METKELFLLKIYLIIMKNILDTFRPLISHRLCFYRKVCKEYNIVLHKKKKTQ